MLQKFYSLFFDHLKAVQSCSPHTLRNYAIDLNDFLSFIGAKSPLDTINRKSIRNFLSHLSSQNKSKRTIARKLSSLRSFFKFLCARKLISESPLQDIENPKLDKKIPPSLSYQQVERLFQLPDTSTLMGMRDRCMMELLYSSGLRVSELVGMNRSDISPQEYIVRIRGKGKKERIVPITKNGVEWMEKYLQFPERYQEIDGHQREQDQEAIFLNRHGTRLTTRSVDRIFEGYLRYWGLSLHVTPHTIRHTIATHWLENGMDLKTIQMILGHSALSTTTIYTQVSNKLKKKVYDAAHPRAKAGGLKKP